jgi:hypothetical protein
MIPEIIKGLLESQGHFVADESESQSEAEEVAAIEKDELENHADFVVNDSVEETEISNHESDEEDPDYETEETIEAPTVDQLCSSCANLLCKNCRKLLDE